MPHQVLFSPLQIRGLHLPNRIVMAPMSRYFAVDGTPAAGAANYYARRAAGGVGLILTEGTVIDRPASKNSPGIPHFHGEALPGWRAIVESVHGAGGRIAAQLWHTGGSIDGRWPDYKPRPIDSPSGLMAPGKACGEPMSEEAIADTITAYGEAAAAARSIGFDAAEIHGAHGYLIDEFFWQATNLRSDRWGGVTLRERTAFAVELIKTVRKGLGSQLPLSFRLSQWKMQDFSVKLAATAQELSAWVEPLAEAGVDIFHCSQRRFAEPEFADSDLNLAGWVKKLTGRITITVGSVGLSGELMSSFAGQQATPVDLHELDRRLERGDFDLVAVGRALLGDPDWVLKIHAGDSESLRPFSREALQRLI